MYTNLKTRTELIEKIKKRLLPVTTEFFKCFETTVQKVQS